MFILAYKNVQVDPSLVALRLSKNSLIGFHGVSFPSSKTHPDYPALYVSFFDEPSPAIKRFIDSVVQWAMTMPVPDHEEDDLTRHMTELRDLSNVELPSRGPSPDEQERVKARLGVSRGLTGLGFHLQRAIRGLPPREVPTLCPTCGTEHKAEEHVVNTLPEVGPSGIPNVSSGDESKKP